MSDSIACIGNEGLFSSLTPRLAEAGYALVEDPLNADIVLIYDTIQSHLEDRYFDDKGLIQVLEKGTIIIDISAETPNFVREVYAVATVSDLVFIEAPMIVLDPAVKEAFGRDNIACFLAEEENDLEQDAKDVLDVLFSTVQHTGGSGSAQLARAAYSMQIVSQVISTIEANALYKAANSSPVGMLVSAKGPEATSVCGREILDAVEKKQFQSDYTIEMLMSEITAALMAADDVELILPQTEAAQHILELLALIGGAEMGPAALSLNYEDEAVCNENGLDWKRAEAVY
ncbi:MAG: NAD(P)-dependent oxidoreductase, partial [Eggerthellaceae bacterium]|nr:NAD(P)-dependent oxidoreductase [Eggerthellaceae bacterium]